MNFEIFSETITPIPLASGQLSPLTFMITPVLAAMPADLLSRIKEFGIASPIACGIIFLLAVIALIASLIRRGAVNKAVSADDAFLSTLQGSPHVLSMFQDEKQFSGSLRWRIYQAASREVAFHLLGTDVVDKNFPTRLRAAGKLAPTQLAAVQRAMNVALGDFQLGANALPTGASGLVNSMPWLGLVASATVFVVTALGPDGSSLSLARLVLPALLPFVMSIIAFLALFGLGRSIANDSNVVTRRAALFSLELANAFDRVFVDHNQTGADLPSLASLGVPDFPGFNMPPPEGVTRFAGS